MRVVCIDDKDQPFDQLPKVKKGNIYNVVEEFNYTGPIGKHGLAYMLAECGKRVAFSSSMFVEINEDQQDETEMERSELVKEMKS